MERLKEVCVLYMEDKINDNNYLLYLGCCRDYKLDNRNLIKDVFNHMQLLFKKDDYLYIDVDDLIKK